MSDTSETTLLSTWQQLCEALSPDPDLFSRVRSAQAGGDPWSALVAWLDDHDLLVEIDRTLTGEDLADYLSTLPLLERIDLGPVAAEPVPLRFAVPRANAILARNFFTLLLLDVATDALPLALVSTEASARVQELATRLGHTARPLLDGDTPAADDARGYSVALPFVPVAATGPRPVNFGKRLLALVIDAVLLYAVALGGVALGIWVNGGPSGRGGVIGGVVAATLALYLVALTVAVARTGRSAGLFLLGLRLVRADDGRAPGIAAAAGRGALVVLFVLWVWAVVVLITTLVDPNGRGLVDKAAGTLMVDTRRARASVAG